ncbi:MAG: polyphosphate kinase 2 family protein [Pseudomonadales bacterium]|nr:polyphosphate kinase 2 family protein [Pseudomonadales bacterium]NIX09411.1 polyphosphate kinase 2 family protein [Pseudomonadales bacterium]
MGINIEKFAYPAHPELKAHPTLWKVLPDAKEAVTANVERLSELQERLYADNRYSVLMVFQGMDAAGKDSTIKYVTSGVNPMGFHVVNFKQPTYKELDHNYLWRYWRAMPERGRIGIFNRSHYEEVGVARVHPEIIERQNLPSEHVNGDFWENRLEDIRALERHLHTNGTIVLKFFLNISRKEQKARLMKRLTNPDKHWKFDPRDIDEREHWDDHMQAYEAAIAATHCEHAPWYVIPADDKWTMRVIVAEVLCAHLERLKLSYPPPKGAHKHALAEALSRLKAEKD